MNVHVKRNPSSKKSTIGSLFINGVKMCATLEDIVRPENEKKIYGETAIPAGKYKITLRKEGTMYEHLKKQFANSKIGQERGTLWIRNIPGFEYVLIHPGNTPADTLGCILVGMKTGIDCIIGGTSTPAYTFIYPQIADAIERGEPVFITIE